MSKFALLARLQAKSGKEAEVAELLKSALPLAEAEPGTRAWFALQFGPSSSGIFDSSDGEANRQAHLDGPIAAALMARAGELLSQPPQIEKVGLLATRKPH